MIEEGQNLVSLDVGEIETDKFPTHCNEREQARDGASMAPDGRWTHPTGSRKTIREDRPQRATDTIERCPMTVASARIAAPAI